MCRVVLLNYIAHARHTKTNEPVDPRRHGPVQCARRASRRGRGTFDPAHTAHAGRRATTHRTQKTIRAARRGSRLVCVSC